MNVLESLESKKVTSVWVESEQKWYFVVADAVQKITKNKHPKDYTKKLRRYDNELARVWYKLVFLIEVDTNGGRQYMNSTDIYGVLRILRSVRSHRGKNITKTGRRFRI